MHDIVREHRSSEWLVGIGSPGRGGRQDWETSLLGDNGEPWRDFHQESHRVRAVCGDHSEIMLG